MKEIRQQFLTGERALFQGADLKIYDTIFDDGESPLKESHNIELRNSMFKWKYPLWYSDSISVKGCTWFDMARAGVWYTNHMVVKDCAIEAPKNFRRCVDLTLSRVSITNAVETLWNCKDVVLVEYLGWNAKNLTLIGCTIESLQGMCYIDHLVMKDCKLINTTLAFEYSTVDAQITNKIDSVLNPTSGEIRAKSIGKLILEKDKIDPSKTKIICEETV